MYNIQQQEDMDYQHGSMNEFQNALTWSRMNQSPDDSFKINECLKQGKFVVVS